MIPLLGCVSREGWTSSSALSRGATAARGSALQASTRAFPLSKPGSRRQAVWLLRRTRPRRPLRRCRRQPPLRRGRRRRRRRRPSVASAQAPAPGASLVARTFPTGVAAATTGWRTRSRFATWSNRRAARQQRSLHGSVVPRGSTASRQPPRFRRLRRLRRLWCVPMSA